MKRFSTWTREPSSARRVLVSASALSQLGILSLSAGFLSDTFW